MYNDVNLPNDQAWEAMSADLRRTKEARNTLSKENSYVEISTIFPTHLATSVNSNVNYGKLNFSRKSE